MKKLSHVVVAGVVSLGLGIVSFSSAARAEGPCKKLKTACEAAGFVKGGHKTGKGLHKDCMKPLLAGQTVAGVTVDAGDVSACQAKKEKKKAQKAGE
ncbi:MAG: hypothetical protein JNL01_07025 [Bdellovibrionales bacterium]|nr:hypothetical protein [Bdellovibrionales bacterium]